MEMKKTFVKLGVLAVALALIFASCAQPTDEEEGSGTKAPTIVRLHLDKQQTTDFADVQFEIRIGEELYIAPTPLPIPAGNVTSVDATMYPYEIIPGQNEGKTALNPIVDIADRTRVLAIPAGTPLAAAGASAITDVETTLQASGNKKYLVSGALQAAAGVGATGDGPTGSAIIQTDNDDKTQRYIDIELVDVRPGSKGYGSVYQGSISGYLELAIYGVPTAPATNNSGMEEQRTYLYTKDKHGFNDFLRMATQDDVNARAAVNGTVIQLGQPLYRTGNANIKKVSLKPGINDVYLSFFSYAQYNE
jgi:hypothetical protein